MTLFNGKKHWVPGAILRGKIVESPEEKYWIVSLGGQLVGVRNESGSTLKPDQFVDLEVVSQNPFQFRILGSSKGNRKGINVRV